MIAIVGSPPYAETNQDYTSGFEYVKRQPGEENRNGKVPGNYGQTPGQLAALPPGAAATETRNDMTEITDWTGCYDNGWKGLITDAAFAHPAKFSRNLIFRIIEHLLADGAIQPGDTILDPFGGVGLGALPSVSSGLNWVGCELERKFVDMGAGMDCPGMSKAEWIRFYGRWGKVNYRDDWHWCPDCVTGAGRVSDGHKLPLSANQKKRRRRIRELEQKTGRQVTLFDRLPFPELVATSHKQAGFFEAGQPSTDYKRDGRIPHSDPHHYTGNVELFAKYARDGATARLLQGDSRRLAEVVSGAAGVVGSPPFENSIGTKDEDFWAKHNDATQNWNGATRQTADYGDDPANIGNDSGETFWSAAKLIIDQCYQILPPGAPAVWVVKSYVKNGQIVDFPGQWQALCEACGFETVHIHRAWLVKRNGAQATMDGGAVSKDIQKKSFFRRLAEKNGAPPIDFETILCTRKRAAL